MIEMNKMTKRIKLEVSNIDKAQDKNFVFYIYESLLDNLLNDNKSVSKIYCLRESDNWKIEFDLKIGRHGDLTWVLMRENLYLIAETEPEVSVRIIDIEDEGTGVIYILKRIQSNSL